MTRSALMSGPGLMVAGAIVVVAGMAAFGFFKRAAPPAAPDMSGALPVAQVAPPVVPAPEPAAPVPVADARAEDAPDPQAAARSLKTLRISLVTIAPDGAAQVAGFADPGAMVEILLDGAVVGSVAPGSDGAFYLALMVSPSQTARALSLRATRDGAEALSEDLVLIQPVLAVADAPTDSVMPTADMADDPVMTAVDTSADPAIAAVAPAEGAMTAAVDPAAGPVTAVADPAADPVTAVADPAAGPGLRAAAAPADPVLAAKAVSPSGDDNDEGATMRAPVSAAAPALISASPEGVRVLQPAIPADTPPEVMASVALDSIAYAETGDVQLTGRGGGQTGSFVRVYLDNRALITLPIAPDGSWQTDLPPVDSGVYTLRVDQIDSAGQVTSRVETPFKREDPVALTAALKADVALAQAITVQPGSTLWAIARDRYGEGMLYLRVFEANRDRIRNPDLIYPGQVFDLPE